MRFLTLGAAILHCLILATLVACSHSDSLPTAPVPIDKREVQLDAPSDLMKAVDAADRQAFRQALASGAQVNGVYQGETALQRALAGQRFGMARILLKAGADWRVAISPGEPSALMLAAKHGQNDLVKQLILLGAELDDADPQGYTALVRAAENGHLTTMNILLNAGANPNTIAADKSVLMYVVENNNALLTQVLIKAGADVNYTDADGDTALKIARRFGYFDIDLMLVQAGARF